MTPLPVRYRRADGAPRISVTQVLTVAGRIDAQWYSAEAAARGTAVHRITEYWDTGRDWPEVIPADYVGYLAAYTRFLMEAKPVYGGIEVAVQSDTLDLGGRIDRDVVQMFGCAGILDIKTGGPADWHRHQLAAYNAMRPRGIRWVLYLRPNGRYTLVTHDDPFAYREFLFDLATARGLVTAEGDYWIARSV